MFVSEYKEKYNQENFYLNKRKKGIFLTHNTAVIG
jgi:hypothetical protein